MQDNNPNNPSNPPGNQFTPTSLDALSQSPVNQAPISDPSQIPTAPFGPSQSLEQNNVFPQAPINSQSTPPPAQSWNLPPTPAEQTPTASQQPAPAAPIWDSLSSSPTQVPAQSTAVPPNPMTFNTNLTPSLTPDPIPSPNVSAQPVSQPPTWPQVTPIPDPVNNLPTSAGAPLTPNVTNPTPLNLNSSMDPIQTAPEIGLPQTPPVQNQDFNQIPTPQAPQENVPTDLSHLIGSTDAPPPPDFSVPQTALGAGGMPPIPPTDNSIPASAKEPQTLDAHGGNSDKHMNLSVVLIVVGIAILLLVTGLSAFFFFGPGKASNSTKNTEKSVPATETSNQAPLTNPPKSIVPAEPSPNIQLTATGSGTLPVASQTPASSSGTSALDLLRAKQSPSPSPKASGSPKASPSSTP